MIPGGTGHVGAVLQRHFEGTGHEVVIVSRQGPVTWDGKTHGPWAREIDGADVVINLAGRSVDCRYNGRNLAEMMNSRVDSTRVVGQAIAQAKNPPHLWLQASTATIYSHRLGTPHDEASGQLGGKEPGVPKAWQASIAIAKAWELELDDAETPQTRKIAMRSAMTMSPDPGSVFDVLARLSRRGVGRLGSGNQYVSWIHERDFCRAIDFLIERENLRGAINLCSPHPLPQYEFLKILRRQLGAWFALPIPAPFVEFGAWLRGTESELVLKSRRVFPGILINAGFEFEFPRWEEAARDLVLRLPTRNPDKSRSDL